MTGPSTDAATIYDAFADKYRAYSQTKSAYIAAVDDQVVAALTGSVAALLDYGAGDGVRGAAVADRVRPQTFLQADISPEMVARCSALGRADQVYLVTETDWSKSIPKLDAVVCLWNVLGHVPDTASRRDLLTKLHALMKPGGRLCIDVNNRHYVGYGVWQSRARRFVDALWPNYERGDVRFNWKIDGVDYPASGHFFTPAEMRDLLTTAGYQIETAVSVDYQTGTVSSNLTEGQLFFVARASA